MPLEWRLTTSLGFQFVSTQGNLTFRITPVNANRPEAHCFVDATSETLHWEQFCQSSEDAKALAEAYFELNGKLK